MKNDSKWKVIINKKWSKYDLKMKKNKNEWKIK